MLGSVDQATYRKQGYLIVENMLDGRELAALQGVAETLLAEPVADEVGFHKIGKGQDLRFLRHRHQDQPALREFLFSDKIVQVLAVLLGPNPHLFNEQFVVKGPKTGAKFAWHQDGAYVGFDHPAYISLWFALDDTTEENGCVRVLPRDLSRQEHVDPHRLAEDKATQIGYDGDNPGIAATCAAGSMVAFSSTTLHSSGGNTTDRARRAYLAQFSPAPIIDPTSGKPRNFAFPLRKAA